MNKPAAGGTDGGGGVGCWTSLKLPTNCTAGDNVFDLSETVIAEEVEV